LREANDEDPVLKMVRAKLRAAAYGSGKGVEWNELFLQYDKSGDGVLDVAELTVAIRKSLKINPLTLKDRDIKSLFKVLDDDNSGEISVIELTGFVGAPPPQAKSGKRKAKEKENCDNSSARNINEIFSEVISTSEKIIVCTQEISGPSSKPVLEETASLVNLLNEIALNCTNDPQSHHKQKPQQEHQQEAQKRGLSHPPSPLRPMDLLQKADFLTRNSTDLMRFDEIIRIKWRAVTLNNIGYYMINTSKPRIGLKYLTMVLRLESKFSECKNSAGTHVNIAVVLGDLGRNKEAARHAMHAIKFLQADGDGFRPEVEEDEEVSERSEASEP